MLDGWGEFGMPSKSFFNPPFLILKVRHPGVYCIVGVVVGMMLLFLISLPFTDSQRLCDYSIAEGTKLYMVAKPTPPTTKPVEPSETQPPAAVATPVEIWKNKTIFINLLYLFLRDHFSKEHSRNIIDTFKAVCKIMCVCV